jgi:hypothetical protein
MPKFYSKNRNLLLDLKFLSNFNCIPGTGIIHQINLSLITGSASQKQTRWNVM